MAKKKKVGFGIVGCGVISDFHAEALKHIRNAELVACHDMIPKGAKRLAKQFGCQPYTDYKAFLAHPGLDVVTIATPSGAHLEPAVKAAKAGKHLLVEKPLEITLARCDRIIEAARKARVLLGGIFPSRYSDTIQAIKAKVDKKRFGKIAFGNATVKWFRTQEYYDSGGWRGSWELDGGGALMNQSIHTVDLFQWLLGPVKEVNAITARRTHKRIAVEDVAIAAVTFKSGAIGMLQGTTSAYPGLPREIEIFGDQGSMTYTDDDLTRWDMVKSTCADRNFVKKYLTRSGGAAGAADPRAISFKPHQRQFEEFLKALDGRCKLSVDGKEARKAVELIIAVYLSAQRGKPVALPLSFKGSPNPKPKPKPKKKAKARAKKKS